MIASSYAFLVDFLSLIGHPGAVVAARTPGRASPNMDRLEIERVTREHLPEEFLAASIRSVFLARKLAYDLCRAEFEEPEVVNVEPFAVRGKVESLIRNTAERFDGLSAAVVQSAGWNHTEITSGPVVLTSHAVETTCGMVYDAKYRRSLAESQASLISPEKMIAGARLYALLLHGPYRGRTREETADYAYLPGSVYLAFPEAAMKRYAHKINLYERFAEVVDGLLPQEWDTEARVGYKWRAGQVGAA
jgi:hypothetical protein